jgi:sulfatase maturation enzyme AslB (radical SAM superfamily)
MDCKFIQNGIAISYDHVVKPCCVWKIGPEWAQTQQLSNTNLATWHISQPVVGLQKTLHQGKWPTACGECARIENRGRSDSMRLNGNSSYADYSPSDITLEIRPGNTCNFACQTCWPAASSRVAQYHSQAGLIDIKPINSKRIDDFEFLLPIKHRIRDVILLGGEPFYDKACREFLAWSQQHLSANITMFTNGSIIDWDFLTQYQGQITLVFSMDAVGRAAEYVRMGTVWDNVWGNYQRAKSMVNTRVNITTSVYNYHHLESLMELLTPDWPEVVSFGTPFDEYLLEGTVPAELRKEIVDSLNRAVRIVESANIETGQQQNAVNALNSIRIRLQDQPWNPDAHQQWCKFVNDMDRVKGISAADYCSTLAKLLQYKVS